MEFANILEEYDKKYPRTKKTACKYCILNKCEFKNVKIKTYKKHKIHKKAK